MADSVAQWRQESLPYRVASLVFIRDEAGRFLLLKRTKNPNKNCWSPIGGKLDMVTGESPFECAIRETYEETGVSIQEKDLHLFGVVAEKNYEQSGHWLLFMFSCLMPFTCLPDNISEGVFGFFYRNEIEKIQIPETDRYGLWPLYDKFNETFSSLRVDCMDSGKMNIVLEECLRSCSVS